MPNKELVTNRPYVTRDGSVTTLTKQHKDKYIGYVKLDPEVYEEKIAAVITKWYTDGSNVYNSEFDIK